MHLFLRLWWTHCTKTRDSQDNATSLPRWKYKVQTRASLSDQGPAQPRAAREQRTPFTGCTTSVLTNGPITCDLNCWKRRSFLKHLLRHQIFSTRLSLWGSQPSITTETVHTWSRVIANNAALDTALDEMAQNTAKQNILSSLQVHVPDSFWLPFMARSCFLARQDRWLGTLVLTSTLWAAFDLNSGDGARRPSEPEPDFARCGFVQASHCEFGAFFSRRWWSPFCIRVWNPFACDYEYLDRFVFGRKMKIWDFLGLVPAATELHARRLQWYQNLMRIRPTRTSCFPSLEKLLLSRTSFLMRVAEYATHHVEGLGNGRKTWMVLEALFFLNVVEERWGSGFWTVGSGKIFGILDMNGIRAAY